MNEIILFGGIILISIVVFLLMKRKNLQKEGLPTQNYDDKVDRFIEQLDNI